MSNYQRAKIKEKHVVEILRRKGYDAELLECFDNYGNELPQTYKIYGYNKSAPDINAYSSSNKKEIILRVEVKGFENLPEINGRKLLAVERRKFNHYAELLFLSEVETKIIFVIGKIGMESQYEYYWETLDNLSKIKHIVREYSFDDGNSYSEFMFWNPKSLHYGLDGFC